MAVMYKQAVEVLDATGVDYRDLNQMLRSSVESGVQNITINNVCGQRYIGTNLYDLGELKNLRIEINGTPGNDLGAFLDGPEIVVNGNAQDGCGNTMNSGRIVVHGRAGDITGFAARGGRIFIRDDVGYRVGIHMKEYEDRCPVMVIGGWAQDFLGEYMAGGVMVLLDLNNNPRRPLTKYIGTGMHGGNIYVRGEVSEGQVGREVGIAPVEDDEWTRVSDSIREYGKLFNKDVSKILSPEQYVRLWPKSKRPYGNLYAY